MAGTDTLRCQLITPEAVVIDTQASAVVLTAHDGEIGILRNRAPLLCKLGIGELRVTTAEGRQRFYVDGGFAHVIDNEVTVLSEQAIATGQIDAAEAEKELADLHDAKPGPHEDPRIRALRMKRAKAKIRLAGRS